jgi:hypothetical protein
VSVDVRAVTADEPASQAPAAARSSLAVTLLFALTSFVGASLLFVVQPMIARLVLPQFGGSSTVWSTSSLFFQVVLLVGYVYVHASTTMLGRRAQPLLHLGLLLLPLVALPVALPASTMGEDGSPVLWLLRTLALTIGLPFAVISTTGPLLQKWYSWTVGRRSEDPYFLFATSNLGSFGGLLAYPFLVEPLLTLDQQRLAWSVGFGVFMALMASCGVVALVSARAALRPADPDRPAEAVEPAPATRAAEPLPRLEVLRWLALAFLPSTLMLGVTAHISTDVAAIPLMWVVPLAIYLATFVVAFARTSRVVGNRWYLAVAATAAVAALAWVRPSGVPLWAVIGIDLALLLTVAFTAHAELAARRPSTRHLTFFYIVVAAGGALGGLLNGLLAPVLFTGVWEFPLALLGAAALAWSHGRPALRLVRERYHPAFVVLLEAAAAFVLLLVVMGVLPGVDRLPGALLLLLWIGAGVLVSLRPRPLVLALAAVLALPLLVGGDVLLRDRSFYGSYTVKEDGGVRVFSHGTTVHGQQALGSGADEPSTYYARSGPVGDAFEVVDQGAAVATVGLGVGTIAAYGEPGQTMTFFEIDPSVVEVASDPTFFTYLSDSAATVEHVVGDGRLRLEEQPPASYDVLFLDAFTSDAIPVHLLTQEAFTAYARALTSDGLLMVHISNRVFDLEPVIAAGADHLGWHVATGEGRPDPATGATPSVWIALSPDADRVDELLRRDGWREPGPERVRWTDDYSSVLTVLDLE